MARTRPAVFIGSSTEGHRVAQEIQVLLDKGCEAEIWSQGVFGLGQGTLESLVLALDRFDFAVLVLTADDLTVKREVMRPSPRDNVLFELGLFVGGLGGTGLEPLQDHCMAEGRSHHPLIQFYFCHASTRIHLHRLLRTSKPVASLFGVAVFIESLFAVAA